MMISYAQNREDVLLNRCFKDIAQGFYIDVGAADPVTDSVTKHFYDLGWSGINIEPTTAFFKRLKQERRRDVNLQLAAGAETGSIKFYEIANTGLSTTVERVAEEHKLNGFDVAHRTISLMPLNHILSEQKSLPTDIHFLKIDVEGAEEDVLRGLSLKTYQPWVIIMEATEPNSTEMACSWEGLILTQNYLYAYFDGLNRYYVRRDHEDLLQHFSRPVNVLDDYVPLVQNHLKNTITQKENERVAVDAELAATKHLMAHTILQKDTALAEREGEFNILNSLYHETIQSTSWRITKPLRDTKETILQTKTNVAEIPNKVILVAYRIVIKTPILENLIIRVTSRFPRLKGFGQRARNQKQAMIAAGKEKPDLANLPDETTNIYSTLKSLKNENRN